MGRLMCSMAERSFRSETSPKGIVKNNRHVQIITQVSFSLGIIMIINCFKTKKVSFLHLTIFKQADRTYASFLSDKNYFGDNFVTLPSLNVVSIEKTWGQIMHATLLINNFSHEMATILFLSRPS